eukprot:6179529-Pleurochrysis_carterae.AAC.1
MKHELSSVAEAKFVDHHTFSKWSVAKCPTHSPEMRWCHQELQLSNDGVFPVCCGVLLTSNGAVEAPDLLRAPAGAVYDVAGRLCRAATMHAT